MPSARIVLLILMGLHVLGQTLLGGGRIAGMLQGGMLQEGGAAPQPLQGARSTMPRSASWTDLQAQGPALHPPGLPKVSSMTNLQSPIQGGPFFPPQHPQQMLRQPAGLRGPPHPHVKQESATSTLPIPPQLVGRLKPETLQQLHAQHASGGPNSLPAAFEKKLRRLEKNRESARECRRRKKEHVMELQKQVARLEAENLKLKLQLKVGEESEAQEREEKERITKKLDEMVKTGASEQDIWQTIDMFKERYSDYGSDRRSAIEFHINQLEKLLLPTKLTKLCMWVMLHFEGQGKATAPRPGGVDVGGEATPMSIVDDDHEDKPLQAVGPPVIQLAPREQPPYMPAIVPFTHFTQQQAHASKDPSLPSARDLWLAISRDIGVGEAQQQRLLSQRGAVVDMDKELQWTLGILYDLRHLIDDKNSSLDQELLEVQKILTPTQTAKFILWITQNPACMHMLNQLWHHVYERTSAAGPGDEKTAAARETSSSMSSMSMSSSSSGLVTSGGAR